MASAAGRYREVFVLFSFFCGYCCSVLFSLELFIYLSIFAVAGLLWGRILLFESISLVSVHHFHGRTWWVMELLASGTQCSPRILKLHYLCVSNALADLGGFNQEGVCLGCWERQILCLCLWMMLVSRLLLFHCHCSAATMPFLLLELAALCICQSETVFFNSQGFRFTGKMWGRRVLGGWKKVIKLCLSSA